MSASVKTPETLEACAQELLPTDHVEASLRAWFDEDQLPRGDVTSEAVIPVGDTTRAAVVAREAMTVSGIEPLARGLASIDGCPSLDASINDGCTVEADTVLGYLSGARRGVLGAERTILNILGRMAGVATLTRRYVGAVAGTRAVICDTRKTTPGLRRFEKYAVACGGGTLHRMGLHDAAMFKDNHLAAIPADELGPRLGEACARAREAGARFVEIEVDTLEQLDVLLGVPGIDIVLLDNMPPEVLREAVTRRNAAGPGIQLEASGGITLETVAAIAATGVERISVGALTRGAQVLDIGLDG